MFSIPASISPVNRILLGNPPPSPCQTYRDTTQEGGGGGDGAATGAESERYSRKQDQGLMMSRSRLDEATSSLDERYSATGAESERYSRKQHQALMSHYQKPMEGHGAGRGGEGGGGTCVPRSARFSPREHAAVIQRALALQSGGRSSRVGGDGGGGGKEEKEAKV